MIFVVLILYNGDTLNNERIVNMKNKYYVDFSTQISPIEFALQMFKNTAGDGTLYLNKWYDTDCEDCLTYNNFVAKIDWSAEDAEYAIGEFQRLYDELDVIADHLEELDGTTATAQEILPDELVSSYCIYVAPLDATNKGAEAVGRVSEGPCGYELIRHSQRLCRLLALDAPQMVIDSESRMLMASIIIHTFGKGIERV